VDVGSPHLFTDLANRKGSSKGGGIGGVGSDL